MSASPEPEQPPKSFNEYITLCADLHNSLLAKSLNPNSPPPETTADLVQRYESYRANTPLNTYTDASSCLDPDSPLAALLSQLRTTIPSRTGNPIPLTPLLYQPIPEWFFPPLYTNDFDAASSPFLLLYPQRLACEPPMDGGLFVDIYTLRGIWLGAPPGPRIPPSETWLPLDYLFKLELSRWESGRYVHDPNAEDGLRIQKWVPVPAGVAADYPNLQVAEAISNWERLLSAIEAKLHSPTPENPSKTARDAPLRPEAMEGLRLSNFASHFLTRASQPKGWTFIAPGIKTFSEKSLREAYSDEPENSFRRTFTTSEEGDDWATLVLPSVGGPVPADVSDVPDLDISSFDKPWDLGR